jgi:hypothetical protein
LRSPNTAGEADGGLFMGLVAGGIVTRRGVASMARNVGWVNAAQAP